MLDLSRQRDLSQITNVTDHCVRATTGHSASRIPTEVTQVKQTVYLSLGSNIGDRRANLLQALARLADLGKITKISAFYETEPVEVEGEQPWFLNCALGLETDLDPQEILAGTLAIEQAMGRRRDALRAPRTIDIDLLLFGDVVLSLPHLTIPHPGLERRRFVLEPLAEIAAGIRHPVTKRTVREMLAALPPGSSHVRRLNVAE